jgi:threonine dehydrogenase-like Zn-dependent dehydrogenase
MKAICWHGRKDVRVENVPQPGLLNKRDAIVKISLTSICGSDLHLYHGVIPAMKEGDILGHEFMGEVVEVGTGVPNLKKGDRVVVPFCIACGNCFFCRNGMTSQCDNSNPNSARAEKLYGFTSAGLFGYSHTFGGYAGGQAQYARVPFADAGPMRIPESVTDEQALFLTDIFPTGYQAAENCAIREGDTIAIWGCGPVGQFAVRSAFLLGASRVIAIDNVPSRLELAKKGGAETLNYSEGDVVEKLTVMTAGRGPDACIDAVGLEAHGTATDAVYDYAKSAVRLETDRPHVLRQAIYACRKGGTISIAGVYGGSMDKFPLGVAFAKGLTLRMGQTNVHKYLQPLLERVEKREIDPSFVISHRMSLDQGAQGYSVFDAQDGCTKVVLKP